MWFHRFVRGMQYLTLAACAGFVVLLFTYDPSAPSIASTDDRSDAALGAEVFAAHCANCHGDEGEGGYGPPIGPEILDEYADDAALIAFVEEGTGAMPAFGDGQLTAAELRAVAVYTREVLGGAAPVVEQVDPDVAASGAAIYADRCASCHGEDATGGFGPGLAGGAAIENFPDVEDQIAVVVDGRNAMPGFADDLTAEEIEAVVAYTRSL
jgi:mono/diheme cytochrome c family protein